MQVTAAITTYNREGFLPGALESVFAQTYEGEVEVLVVDDGSTDDTPDVLARYGDRIRVVRQENGGRSAARNTAVREARAPFLSFLDSDDRWLSDKLARQLPVLEADDRVGMVHGHVDLIDEADRPLPDETARHHRLFSDAHRNGVTYAGYAFDCRCFSSALTARVEAIRSVGLYDPALLLDDYDVYLRLALDWRIVFQEGPAVALYRHHPGQMTTYELTTGQIQTAEKHLALLDERDDVPDAALARRNFLLMLARSHAVLGDQSASRRHLREAIRLDRSLLREPWVLRRLVASVVKR
ncbi:MAG: glycosyltransferase family 2 protein [Actinomycetota bacterium]|nr:glycosyltransferase family 2 protein [Actinomycetota bacterium]